MCIWVLFVPVGFGGLDSLPKPTYFRGGLSKFQIAVILVVRKIAIFVGGKFYKKNLPSTPVDDFN